MKLKTFNQSNLPVIAKGKPTIRLSLPSGLVTISPAAGEVLGLTDLSHVELCQNEEVPSDWYIHVINTPPPVFLSGERSPEPDFASTAHQSSKGFS